MPSGFNDQLYISSNMCAELFWLVMELHNALEAKLANDKPAMPLVHNLSSLPSTFLTRGLYVSVNPHVLITVPHLDHKLLDTTPLTS